MSATFVRNNAGTIIGIDVSNIIVGSTPKLKCYYSHTVETYGTEQEDREMIILKAKLPSYYKIINPKWYNKGFIASGRKFNYWYQIIDECIALAYSKYQGVLTKGVATEVEYASQIKIDIYEILEDKLELKQIKKGDPVTNREWVVKK